MKKTILLKSIIMLLVSLIAISLIYFYYDYFFTQRNMKLIGNKSICNTFESFEEQLVCIINTAIKKNNLSYLDSSIYPLNANFARIDSKVAMKARNNFKKVFTVSHQEAWQYKLNDNNRYALKLYVNKDLSWEIAIIQTGWKHYIDAFIFLFKLPGYKKLNITISYKYLLSLYK